jgi:hypothetical protein
MKTKDIKINKWYMIDRYGFSSFVKGRAVDITGNIITLKFYWGAPFRTNQCVEVGRIIGECKEPSFFSNY